MIPTDLFRAGALAFGMACSSVGPLLAQESAAPPPPLSVTVKTELPRQVPQTHRAYVTADTNKFAFLIPEGFQLINEPASGILKFANPGGSSLITFKILDPLPLDDGRLKPEVCRELLLALHPKGRILEEFAAGAAGRSGAGFDLAWQTLAGGAQCTRTVFVPFDGGVLEFTATTGPNSFSALHRALNRLLLSFAASDNQGRLEVSLLSDRL